MTGRTIEFYVIKDCSGEYDSTEVEYFDTFEDAVAHINDTLRDGRLKYTGWWSDDQECKIIKKIISPEYKTFIEQECWHFENGKLIEHGYVDYDDYDYDDDED